MGWGQNGMWENSSKNQYSSRENCWKRGAWIVCRFKGGGGRLDKKEGNALYVRFKSLVLWISMIDFSTNKYIHNIKMKHPHSTYIYEKQQIKLFQSNSFLIEKRLLVKCWAKLVSFISFFLPIFTRQAALPQDYYRISIFAFPFLPGPYRNKQLLYLADSYITHWFELLYKIPLLLYCEDLQQFCQENMYFLLHVLTTSRSRFMKNNSSLTFFININNTIH